MASGGTFLLGLIAFLLGGQFLLYPFTFYFVQRFKASSYRTREPGDPSEQDPGLESLFSEVISGLEARGFEVAGHFVDPGPARLRFDLLADPAGGDTAMLVHISGPTVSIRYLEYECRFEDGSQLSANNSPLPPGTFAPLPARVHFQFAGVRDPEELYALFQAAVERYFPSQAKLRRAPESLREEMAHEFRKVFEHQVASGLTRRTGVPDEYAPTLRGAFHIVWRTAFPVLAIRRVLYYMRMKRLEAQLRSRLGTA